MSDSEYAKMMLVVCLLGAVGMIVIWAALYGLGIIATYEGPCPWLP